MSKIAKIKNFVADHKDLILDTATSIIAVAWAESQSREVRNAAFVDSIFDPTTFADRIAR